MKLLEILPLARLANGVPDTLSYYTSQNASEGSLALITIQKKHCVGIVVKGTSVAEVKTAIRRQDFSMKKIDGIIAESIIPEFLLKLCAWSARFFLTRKSLMLLNALPLYFTKPTKSLRAFFTENNSVLKIKNELTAINNSLDKKQIPKRITPLFIEGAFAKRVKNYVKQISSILNKNQKSQILIICPTAFSAKILAKEIENDFPDNVFLYGSFINKKKLAQTWLEARNGKRGIFIGTRSAVFLPLPALAAVIIEQEGSINHKSQEKNPRYDARDIAEKISEVLGMPLIAGDNMPRTETWNRIREGLMQYDRLGSNISPKIEIISTQKTAAINDKFSSISPALAEKITEHLNLQKKIMLFCGRRGFALNIICQECGFVSSCSQCETPFTIHITEDILAKRVLICHKCLKREKPPETCPNCKGAKIKMLGIGTQRIMEEARKLFPAARIIRVDSDASNDSKQFYAQLKEINEGAYDIIIGTELAIKPEFLKSFGLVAVISLHQLLQRPDFRQEETAIRTILTLSEIAENGRVIIQTNSAKQMFARELEHFDAEAFFCRDISFRKAFAYPPFAELIKLSIKNPVRLIAEKNALLTKQIIEAEFSRHNILKNAVIIIGPVPAFIPKTQNNFNYIIVLKIKSANGAVKDLLTRSLPPYVIYDVNPITIL